MRQPEPGTFEHLLREARVPVSGLLRLSKYPKTDAGPPVAEGDYHLDFTDAAHLLAELPPKRLQALRMIKRAGPVSIYAAANALGRNYSNVHTDVHKLIEHGLVARDEAGLVTVHWDDVVVQVNASLLEAA